NYSIPPSLPAPGRSAQMRRVVSPATMVAMATPRTLDLVLLGATGFTGGLTAEHLADHAPAGLRWALAGRSQERLEAVRSRLAARRPELADLELVVADSSDAAAMARLAEST